MSPFEYPLEEIRAKCDLVEVVSAYVALTKKSGRNLLGLCPFHNDKNPSLNVSPDRQVWKCFSCGEGGDVFSFVQKIEKCTFPEAVERLAQKAGVTIERTEKAVREMGERDRLLFANNIACSFFQSTLAKSTKAMEYLSRRGVSAETIEKYRLGYAPDDWEQLHHHLLDKRISQQDAVRAGLLIARDNGQGCYDRFRDRLIFPIIDNQDRIIGFGGRTLGDDPAKYLNSPETPLFVKNRTLYGLNFARRAIVDNDRVLIVEGYFDAMTTQEAGFLNTVATMGTALTEEHVNIIARFTKNVVLAFDADSAGMSAALRSWPIFERAGFNVRILSMPSGEDPDSLLRGGDDAQFARLVDEAKPIPDYRIGLVMSKADLQSDEGRASALKAGAAVVAEVESPVERERLIRLLAKYHPNFATGTSLAEDHVRGEVARLRYRPKPNQPVRPQSEPAADAAKPKKLSLVEQSERHLLGILILRGGDASKVFEALPPNQFMGEGAAELAEALNRQICHLGKIDQEILRSDVTGTAAETVLTDILLESEEVLLNHPLDEILKTVIARRNYEKQLRMRELHQKLQEGSIKHGDEEFEEYWRLVQELKKGSGWRR